MSTATASPSGTWNDGFDHCVEPTSLSAPEHFQSLLATLQEHRANHPSGDIIIDLRQCNYNSTTVIGYLNGLALTFIDDSGDTVPLQRGGETFLLGRPGESFIVVRGLSVRRSSGIAEMFRRYEELES